MKKTQHFILYKITNLVNGKIYIGKHKCNRLDDAYFGSGKLLWLAINKYGIKNFRFDLLIDLNNQQEMDLLEQMVVNEDFLARKDVYNISRGGANPCMYGKQNPFFGKSHSEKTKKKISEAHKGVSISEEQRQKISKGLKRLYAEHPEITIKFTSRKNKKQCRNIKTGEIKFFSLSDIPDNFEIYKKLQKDRHVPKEQKTINMMKMWERCRKSKWYNNGISETFCTPDKKPEGYTAGRLPTINIGRTYSKETIEKMRIRKLGKPAKNKGKIFITNGYKNRYISATELIPDGWWHGMTRYASEGQTNETP